MPPSAALDRARSMWAGLAGTGDTFPANGEVRVVASADSALAPDGWVGIVALGGGALATVPRPALVAPVRAALSNRDRGPVLDLDRVLAALPVADVLGPATLAYVDRSEFTGADRDGVAVERLADGPEQLAALLAGADEAEVDESGLAGLTSDAFVIRDGAHPVAAAGWRSWPGGIAHLLVLTAPYHRGRGLGRQVASAATAAALDVGLAPQWRARPAASRRIARSLGFREYGGQLSVRPVG